MADQYHWLDKHIAEQAAYYGRSVDEHAYAMGEIIAGDPGEVGEMIDAMNKDEE